MPVFEYHFVLQLAPSSPLEIHVNLRGQETVTQTKKHVARSRFSRPSSTRRQIAGSVASIRQRGRTDHWRHGNGKGTHTISTRRWSRSQIVASLPTKHSTTDLSNWIRPARNPWRHGSAPFSHHPSPHRLQRNQLAQIEWQSLNRFRTLHGRNKASYYAACRIRQMALAQREALKMQNGKCEGPSSKGIIKAVYVKESFG